MEGQVKRKDIIGELQQRILAMEGFKKLGYERRAIGLGPIEQAFPGHTFPTGTVHELVSSSLEDAAATTGFVAALSGRLIQQTSRCLWVSARRIVFPPALKLFGISPEQIIFIDLKKDIDVLWTVEEALKCDALTAVIGELKELDFAQSRRLQLAVEKSNVTGFIHRVQPKAENTVACVTRWKISPLPGSIEEGVPGVGFPQWNVRLAKVRNGKPGTWQVAWTPAGFEDICEERFRISRSERTQSVNYA